MSRFIRTQTYFLILLLVHFLLSPMPVQAQPVRGVVGDLWADRILGQPDFGSLAPNQVTAKGLFNPYSCVVDTVHNRLYVYDDGNNRVLGVSNLNTLTSGQGADVVLGHPDFNQNGCNGDSNWQNYPTPPTPTASCLCGLRYDQQSPTEGGSVGNMAVDGQGNLYVPDYFNNRVVRYDWPVTTGEAASRVWGQPDFNSYQYNNVGGNVSGSPGNSNLNFYPNGVSDNHYYAGVGTDNWGNLWVADASNNRVLRFPNPNVPSAGVPQTIADVVLGQSNFSSTVAGSTGDLSHLKHPGAVRVDSAGNVYVSDLVTNPASAFGWAGRVLVYKPTGTDASGQPRYGATNMGLAASAAITQTMDQVDGLEWDPSGDLWVSQYYQSVLMHFTLSPAVSATATKVLMEAAPINPGQASGTGTASGDGPNFTDNAGEQPSSYLLAQDLRGSVGVDSSGNVYAPGGRWQDVLRFQAPQPAIGSLPAGEAHSANLQVFKPSQWRVMNNIGTNDMYVVSGVAVGGGQVIESNVNRLAFWNIPSGPASLTNGQTVDGFAGTTTPYLWLYNPFGRIREDHAATQHLWVIHNMGGTVSIEPYLLPLHNGDMPMAGKTLTPPLNLLGGGTVNWTAMEGLAPDPNGQFLWLSDKTNNRVLRVRDPLGLSGGPVVDVILGQPNATAGYCNGSGTVIGGYSCGSCSQSTPSQSTLYVPGALELDHQGNLYVSDHGLECAGNQRMLRWNAATLAAALAGAGGAVTCGIPADGVYGTNGSYTSGGCQTPNGVCGPWEPAFNANDSIMVTGLDSQQPGLRFPIILSNPTSGDNPTGALKDFGPQSFADAFDAQDNLYVAELNRNRILVYFQPFGTPGPTFTSTGTLTPTFTATWSPTITPTPTGTWYTSTPTNSFTLTPTLTPTNTSTPNCCQAASNWTAPGLGGAAGVAVDMSRHRVYAPDRNTGTLYAYDYTGAAITSFGNNGAVTGLAAFCVAVGSCAYDGVYIVQRQNPTGAVVKLDANGNVVWTSANVAGGANRSINVDNTGTVYVCSDGGSVYLLDSTGTLQNTLSGYGFSAPTGSLKVGSTLYVDDTVNNQVVALAQTGAYTYGAATTVASVTSPYVLTQDLAGNFYVASSNTNSFYVYNGAWTLQHTCTSGTYLAGAFGIAVDEAGSVYVAGQSGSHTVYKMQACSSEPAPGTCTPTPTATFTGTWYTATPTSTPTLTPTNTLSPTATSSATPSPTNTLTASATTTPTSSFTLTATVTPTPTATNSPTNTLTSTATNSATQTPTLTATNTPTNTLSPTASATSTASPSATPSPTLTPTATVTNTASSTSTNSATQTLTPSYTLTPSSTPTPTATTTNTLTPTFTYTPCGWPGNTCTSTPTTTSTPVPDEDVVYPNPWNGTGPLAFYHTVSSNTTRVVIKIFTVSMRKIYDDPNAPIAAGQHLFTLDGSRLGSIANGLYYLVVEEQSGGNQTRKIIKLLIQR